MSFSSLLRRGAVDCRRNAADMHGTSQGKGRLEEVRGKQSTAGWIQLATPRRISQDSETRASAAECFECKRASAGGTVFCQQPTPVKLCQVLQYLDSRMPSCVYIYTGVECGVISDTSNQTGRWALWYSRTSSTIPGCTWM